MSAETVELNMTGPLSETADDAAEERWCRVCRHNIAADASPLRLEDLEERLEDVEFTRHELSEELTIWGEIDESDPDDEFPVDWEQPVQEMGVIRARVAELCESLWISPSDEAFDIYLESRRTAQKREAARASRVPEPTEPKREQCAPSFSISGVIIPTDSPQT